MFQTVAALPFHNKLRLLASASASPTVVSIMNFNLLAKCYGSESLNAMMPFDERRQLNANHVKHLRPSILVTEEMDECYLEDFASFGYEKINLHKNENSNCYTGVFLRNDSSCLKCKASEVVKIDQTRSQGVIFAHIVFDVSHPQLGPAPGAERSPILSEFILIATHAKAGRTDELEAQRKSDAKYTFTHLLLEFIRNRCATIGRGNEKQEVVFDRLMQRVIFVGDMNAGPHSYGGQFPVSHVIPWLLGQEKLENGEVETDPVKNPVALVSAFQQMKLENNTNQNEQSKAGGEHEQLQQHPLFTTCKARDGKLIIQTIDYVLMTKNVGDVVGRLETPTEDPEKDLAPHFLPFPKKWGSDHLSVMVFVALK